MTKKFIKIQLTVYQPQHIKPEKIENKNLIDANPNIKRGISNPKTLPSSLAIGRVKFLTLKIDQV